MPDLKNLLLDNNANVSVTIGLDDLRVVATEFANYLLDGMRENVPPIDGEEELLTIADVCQLLGVTKPTLWRWDKMGYLCKVMVGNRIHYRKEDVKRIMNNNQQ